MNFKNKKIIIVTVLILFLLLIFYKNIIFKKSDFEINKKNLKQHILLIDKDKIHINDVIPFEWDYVYFPDPYESKEEIEKTLKISSKHIEANIYNEGLIHFIFVKDCSVVCSELGYFDNLGYAINTHNQKYLYSKDNPIFEVNNDTHILNLKNTKKY